jgi:YrhK-like protein
VTKEKTDSPLIIRIGSEELIIRRRYEVLSIVNDFFIAIWFLAGSILFLYPEYEKAAIWLFIIGSSQFLLRPLIRLIEHIHIKRVPPSNS